ncbi:MAG: DNA repair protein RecN [Candidatus Limnocylindrales bacterium]|nr:DNA repair protein RecN [Candidatus Limnocylindrales bacterium]
MGDPRGPEPAAGRLLELGVADLALIERVRITFAAGFNVLTGETGAGKSLLIDALGLALGARADAGLVRHGAEAARVEALFDRLPEALVCVREVGANGRSVARVDDETVTAGRLAAIAGPLVEIHGQRDQGRLLDERWQRELLDGYGGHAAERAAVAAAVAAWRENEASLAASAIEPGELARRIALLEHEAEEIAAVRLVPGEAAAIRARLDASRHAEAIARWSASLGGLLAGDEPGPESAPGARELAALAASEATALARLDTRYQPLVERLAGVAAELEDLASEVRHFAETVDHDPAALAALEARLSLLYSLERRYGTDVEGLAGRAEQAAAEADRLHNLGAERERRRVNGERLLGEVAEACAALSNRRASAAADLGRAVEAAVGELGLRGTRVMVFVGRRIAAPDEPAIELGGDAVAFDATGADTVVFQIAPNPGEPARPLARIASGGELSRLALAIEEVLAAADATPTLVFDEIDAGIGGRSADPVARTLWLLGQRHQVLCVTHLPQIAAHADAHFGIRKVERAGRMVTDVRRLTDEERLEELAAMIGGPGGGAAAEASAQELLARAAAFRASRSPSGGARG